MKKQDIAVVLLFVSLAIGLTALWVGATAHSSRPRSIAGNVEKVRPAVVHIAKLGICQGSGAIIGSEGIVMTARHVTDGMPGEYEVTLDDGRKFPVKYVVEDKENDIAMLQLDLPKGVTLPTVKLSANDPRVGDPVFIMGSPYGYGNFNSVTLGIISAGGREIGGPYDWFVMMQSDAAAFPGNSGGPTFDMSNEVVGVLVAGQGEGLNFSVPVVRFRDTIEDVRNWFRLQRFDVVEEEERVEVLYGPYGQPIDGTD